MSEYQRIAFFITDNGYGHIMRNLPVVRWLLLNSEIKIVLVSGESQVTVAQSYLATELKDIQNWQAKIEFIKMKMEPGVSLFPNSLKIDWVKLKNNLTVYFADFPRLSEITKQIIHQYRITKIVSDIVPWIFPVAHQLKVKTVLMASYTWIEEYEPALGKKYVEPFVECYQLADQVIMYKLRTEPTALRFKTKAYRVGLCARPTHAKVVNKIKNQFANAPIIFVSTGFRQSSLADVMSVDSLPYNFLVTNGVSMVGSNVFKISADANNTQDYLAASDFCIIKAGWSTLAEGLVYHKKMLLIDRPDAVEDEQYIQQLSKNDLALPVSETILNTVQNLDDTLIEANKFPWQVHFWKNDYCKIGQYLLQAD